MEEQQGLKIIFTPAESRHYNAITNVHAPLRSSPALTCIYTFRLIDLAQKQQQETWRYDTRGPSQFQSMARDTKTLTNKKFFFLTLSSRYFVLQ